MPYHLASAATAGGPGGNEDTEDTHSREGNHVLLMEDDSSAERLFIRPLKAGRGDYDELDFYKRVEILRWPASSMYRSHSLTDEGDFIDIVRKLTYFSINPSYN